jgi:hypothetical protein
MSEIDQRAASRLQLAMIAGGEPESSYFEIRHRRPGGMGQLFFPLADVEATIAEVERLAVSTDVYLACAPRERRDGKADAIKRVWCLWADCDDTEAVERLAAFRARPNLVIRSGSGDNLHAYWQLQEPLSPAWARRANLRLALALGADRAATDAARILRPAGTLNHKHSPSRPVACTSLDLDIWSFDQIVGGLADDAAYAPKPLAGRRSAPRQPVEAARGPCAHRPRGGPRQPQPGPLLGGCPRR